MILGMAPAVKAKIVDPKSIISDGKTGISGAGKNPVLLTISQKEMRT